MAQFKVERYIAGYEWSAVFDLAAKVDGVVQPLDLATHTLSATASISGGTSAVDLTVGSGIEIVSLAPKAQVRIILTAEQTAALGDGRLDITMVREAPSPRRPMFRASVGG